LLKDDLRLTGQRIREPIGPLEFPSVRDEGYHEEGTLSLELNRTSARRTREPSP
jgi:hypothetical protein